MHIEPTLEQTLLRESALRYARSLKRAPTLQEAAAQGWVAACFAEADEGLGGQAADVAPVATALGEASIGWSLAEAVLLPARLLSLMPASAPRSEAIAQWIAGRTACSLAHREQALFLDAESDVATQAETVATGHCVSGTKRGVQTDHAATDYLVTAHLEGELALLLVRHGEAGLLQSMSRRMTGLSGTVHDLQFQSTPATLLCRGATAQDALMQAIAFALLGSLSQVVATCAELVNTTREWLGTRKQFGKALAEQQVLQHRFVDMFIAQEESVSMLNFALYAHGAPNLADHSEDGHGAGDAALAAAAVHIGKSARFIGQQAVHLHGAMGLTEELEVGPSYRRIEALLGRFGSVRQHLRQFAAATA